MPLLFDAASVKAIVPQTLYRQDRRNRAILEFLSNHV